MLLLSKSGLRIG